MKSMNLNFDDDEFETLKERKQRYKDKHSPDSKLTWNEYFMIISEKCEEQ